MIDYIRHGWPTSRKQCPNALKHYWIFRDELVQDQGIIMEGPKLLIPAVMRRKMLEKIHYSHVGADSCLRKARDVLFWPGMAKAVHDYISKCAICNEFWPQQQKEPLIPHDTPKLPWADVAVDLFTFDSVNCCRSRLFFRFFRSGTAARYDGDIGDGDAQAFVRNARHSSDRLDRQRLVSEEFQEFAREWKFNHVTSSPYYTQSNGKAESVMKIAKSLLQKAKRDGRDSVYWNAKMFRRKD